MSERMRYRLQRKARVARPNILGNHSFPVYTFEWKDVAVSNNKVYLQRIIDGDDFTVYRIIDTENGDKEV